MSRLDEYRVKRRKNLKRKILLFVLLFLAIVAGLSIASQAQKISINEVKVSGNRLVEMADIEALVRADLAGNYFHLFSKSNSFIYPAKKIKRDLLTKFKRLVEVSVNIKDIKTLEITVKEREAEYIWCTDLVLTIDEGGEQKCYFLDSDGYIFDFSPHFSDGVYFKFYGKIASNNTMSPIGLYFIPDNLKRVVAFRSTLEKMGLKLISLRAEENGDMNISLSSGAVIIFKPEADFNKLAENLQAALATEPLKTDFVKKYSSLLYIDLRFGNKVYYKFQ